MKLPVSNRKEFGRQHTIDDLILGLEDQELVVYSDNGNRRVKSKKFLKIIEKILPKIGVTRVGDISYLSMANHPVFQSCRPNYFTHAFVGQNSGSLGKGTERTQSIISCLMETLESYCSEPRNPELIRASYDFLKEHKLVCDPRKFIHNLDVTPPELDEALMWTPAYCLIAKEEVLIPAELIYFPFFPVDYSTRYLFPGGSNGLASGSSYIEATIHALYELIERYYNYYFDEGKILIEAIHEEELENVGLNHFLRQKNNDIEPQFYALEFPNIKNMPLILCLIVGEAETFSGWGLSATVDISIDRAFSEALQAKAAYTSGTREDLGTPGEETAELVYEEHFTKTTQPKKRTLRIGDYRKRVHDKKFKTLNDELDFIVSWIKKLGFNNIFVSNLTRVGVDIPVVKVVVPGFALPDRFKASSDIGADFVIKSKFPNIG